MIPHIPQITVKPVALSDRLHDLHRLCATGTATRVQLGELEAMERTMETDQDNRKDEQ